MSRKKTKYDIKMTITPEELARIRFINLHVLNNGDGEDRATWDDDTHVRIFAHVAISDLIWQYRNEQPGTSPAPLPPTGADDDTTLPPAAAVRVVQMPHDPDLLALLMPPASDDDQPPAEPDPVPAGPTPSAPAPALTDAEFEDAQWDVIQADHFAHDVDDAEARWHIADGLLSSVEYAADAFDKALDMAWLGILDDLDTFIREYDADVVIQNPAVVLAAVAKLIDTLGWQSVTSAPANAAVSAASNALEAELLALHSRLQAWITPVKRLTLNGPCPRSTPTPTTPRDAFAPEYRGW